MAWLWMALPACVVLTTDDLRDHDLALVGADTGEEADDTDVGLPDDETRPAEAEPIPLTESVACIDGVVDPRDDEDWFVVTDLSPGDTIEAWVERLAGARLEERMAPEDPGVVVEGSPLVAVTADGTALWFGVSSTGAGGPYTLCLARVETTEVEPNDEPTDPGTLTSRFVGAVSGDLNVTRGTGVLETASDVDRYRLDPRLDVSYTFALDATSPVTAATLVLTDSAGNELARSLPDDPVITWTAGSELEPVDLVVSGEAGAYSVWVHVLPPG